jgi:pimeloyl-ACP methyl ester carboxylesterase
MKTGIQSMYESSAGPLSLLHFDNFPGHPTIIFLHESLGCIELWRDFPERLGQVSKCNVLVYDRLGYGQSGPFNTLQRDIDYLDIEADILLEIMNAYDIEKSILFGHSDGGTIALIFAARYPGRTLGLVTEGAHIFPEEKGAEGIKQAIHAYEKTNLKTKLEKYHGDKTHNVFWIWAGTWLADHFATWNIEHYLPLINCPVLVIQGEEDEYGTIEQVDGIVDNVSGRATKLVLPHVKHIPHKEVPGDILRASKTFISSLTV